MSNKQAVVKELESISPVLAGMKSKDRSSEVSEQYFREMQADVLWKIQQEEKHRVAKGRSYPESSYSPKWWRNALWGWVWRPAVAAGVVALGFWIMRPLFQEKKSEPYGHLTAEETLDFIVEHAEMFEPEELLSALPEESAWMESPPTADEPAGEELMDAIMENLDSEDLETLY